jgi:hypothetical protein
MKHLNKFNQFLNEAFLPQDKKRAIDVVISYLNKNSNMDFYEYEEIWHIQKKNLFLNGQLFISLKSSRAIRFNWIKDDIRSQIHSIDLWNDFEFDSNPDFTLELVDLSVVKYLPQILEFIKQPESLLTEELETESGYDPKKELEDAVKRLGKLRSAKTIASQQQKIERLKAAIAYDEKAEIDSGKINQLDDDLKIDVFKSIELYTIQVARGKSNSLIVSGDAGVGKSRTVLDTLSSLGMEKDKNYYSATGFATTAGLYEILFKNRNRLIVFDDCDAVFKEPESINILKGALDTYEIREIAKLTKGNTFDSFGMDEAEIQEEFDSTGKLPNKFQFTGQIIFISNLPEDKFDSALLSRSLHIDVHLSRKELFERMREIMRKLAPDVDMAKKEESLEFLYQITSSYPTKFDLNIRTLIHSINLRANNEDKMKIGDKEEFIWKLLIKKYLLKSR